MSFLGESSVLNKTLSFFTSFLYKYYPLNESSLFSSIEKIENICYYSFPNEHLICKDCKTVPLILFKNINTIFYECDDKKVYKELNSIFCSEDDDYSAYLICQTHKKIYKYFCTYCNMNICEDCLRKMKKHLDHSLIIFDQMYYSIKEKIKNIKEILKIHKKNNESNNENSINNNISFDQINIVGEKFIRLMSIIFNDFKKYPSYQLFQNILNIYQFINEFIANKDNRKELKDLDYKMKEKIYDVKELNKIIKINLIVTI